MRQLCLQVRSSIFPFKIIPICQFHHDGTLDDRHDLFLAQNIFGNQGIIFPLGLQLHRMGLNGLPERLIGHWFKPSFNIIQTIKGWVFKILHLKSVSNSDSPMQIFKPNPQSAFVSAFSFEGSYHEE